MLWDLDAPVRVDVGDTARKRGGRNDVLRLHGNAGDADSVANQGAARRVGSVLFGNPRSRRETDPSDVVPSTKLVRT